MTLRRLAPISLLCSVLLTGCFQIRTVVFLNEDGSGVIEETVLFASFAINMLSSLSADSSGAFSLIEAEKLRARADSMGAGVRFVAVDSLKEDGFEGYVARYAFEDINTVRLLDNDQALQAGGADVGGDEPSDDLGMTLDNVTFAYDPGHLVIHIPREDPKSGELHPDSVAAKADEIRSQVEETGGLLRAFLADARFSASIVFPGAILETNAANVDSSRVTLVDFEFEPFLDLMEEDPEAAARLQLAQSEAHRYALLEEMGLEGIRYEPADEVIVRFQR